MFPNYPVGSGVLNLMQEENMAVTKYFLAHTVWQNLDTCYQTILSFFFPGNAFKINFPTFPFF